MQTRFDLTRRRTPVAGLGEPPSQHGVTLSARSFTGRRISRAYLVSRLYRQWQSQTRASRAMGRRPDRALTSAGWPRQAARVPANRRSITKERSGASHDVEASQDVRLIRCGSCSRDGGRRRGVSVGNDRQPGSRDNHRHDSGRDDNGPHGHRQWHGDHVPHDGIHASVGNYGPTHRYDGG